MLVLVVDSSDEVAGGGVDGVLVVESLLASVLPDVETVGRFVAGG